MTVYYNENDGFAAAWLRELMAANLIAKGDVDERSIVEVQPEDLRGYHQCHFFAGVGVWSYALRAAGWPDDSPMWTGSCPCQGFSASGKRGGFSDQRHLWPAWFRLIAECRPDAIFGEQVASKDGLAWFDVVSADLEGAGYAIGAADTCAAGFGAPHIRQRLYFVGHAARDAALWRAGNDGEAGGVADTAGTRRQAAGEHGGGPSPSSSRLEQHGELGDAAEPRREGRGPENVQGRSQQQSAEPGGIVRGFWRDAEWLPCRDGKLRPVEPGTFPLAHGAPARVGRLRGYGNALCAPQAIAFIEAYLSLSVS